MAEALQSGDYHIKWTACSDLPISMYDAYVAVSNRTIYCTGSTPNTDNQYEVYHYQIRNNEWKQLPRSGHHLGVIHILDNKLTIIGGGDAAATNKIFNKVTTYNSKTNSWYSHFPNMLHNRDRPGVVTCHDYVIVMGGKSSPDTILDNMEVMNHHHLQWKEVPVHLPIPMWAIKPTICGDNLIIVGYATAKGRNNSCYQIQAEGLTFQFDPSHSVDAVLVEWKKLLTTKQWYTTTIPYSNPVVVIGGSNQGGVPTSDVLLYDIDKNSWRKVDSFTSSRNCVGVTLLNNHTVIIIGGTSGGVGIEGAIASSLSRVEIGTIILNQ